MTFISASLPRQRMASTLGGMRRLLKYKGSVPNYIRQAVETGVYRSNEELAAVWKERKESADDLSTIMRRFRQDVIRGSNVHDYPVEYLILRQHPPIPDPPRIPKRIAKKMRPAPNPVEPLVEKYLTRQERKEKKQQRQQQQQSSDDYAGGGPRTTQEYYRRLLGVSAPPPTSSMGQKPAAVQRAYAAAVKQYELQRTQGLSEADALEQVEALLAAQNAQERVEARKRARDMKEFRAQQPMANVNDLVVLKQPKSSTRDDAKEDAATSSDSTNLSQTLQTIFKADHRTLEGMMRWSERLQAVPYLEWTVGASTALDHWIACRLLGMSEETWAALLEGQDASLLSRGRDIVAVREALFPETALGEKEADQGMMDDDMTDEVEEEKVATMTIENRKEMSIEELLDSLGGLNLPTLDTAARGKWQSRDDEMTDDDLDAKIDSLVTKLQDWRRMNVETPYAEWSDDDKESFGEWMKEYVDTVSSNGEKDKVDFGSTREALLSQPPVSQEESKAFWDAVEDEDTAANLLASVLADGPPAGAGILQSAFWDLPHDEQLERLLNLGAIRPLMDEYTKESDRRKFLQRYGDSLLKGVVMEHLVPDPEGPVQASDLGHDFGLPKDSRFRLEMKAYQSGQDLSSDERTRALYVAWNTQKAGRAHYEEKLFRTGRLGLRYSDPTNKDAELLPDEE